jgi:uncharacterized protein (TIGR02598 family)
MITPLSVAEKTSFARRTEGRKGFSLAEVVMALGIFTMAIVPVIGLLGSGMSISRASIEQSALSAIMQQVKTTVAAGSAGPLFFNQAGDVAETEAESYFKVELSTAQVQDATVGLAAKNLVTVKVRRTDLPDHAKPITTSFVLGSRDPAEM